MSAAAAFGKLSYVFNFFQFAYVTPDIERATRECGAMYGIKRFQINRDVLIETQAGSATLHFALAYAGEQQIEIIQPVGGADGAYRSGLPTDGAPLRLHHVGHLIRSEADWEAVTATLATSGLAIPVKGIFKHEGVALMHYQYADTRELLGHHLEFMYQTAAGSDMFSQVPRFNTKVES